MDRAMAHGSNLGKEQVAEPCAVFVMARLGLAHWLA